MPKTLTDSELQRVYAWIDEIPLSRPKRNIARDFSDGVLMAEVVAHYFPRLVELHNYSQANSLRQKMYNWATLNMKVLKRMDFQIGNDAVHEIVNCRPGAVEAALLLVQEKMAAYKQRKGKKKKSKKPTSARAAAAAPVTSRTDVSYGSHAVASAAPPSAGPASRYPAEDTAQAYMSSARGSERGGKDGASDELLAEKDQTIGELNETIEILELKIKKLEQLVRLKDSRIQTLTARLKSKDLALHQ